MPDEMYGDVQVKLNLLGIFIDLEETPVTNIPVINYQSRQTSRRIRLGETAASARDETWGSCGHRALYPISLLAFVPMLTASGRKPYPPPIEMIIHA